LILAIINNISCPPTNKIIPLFPTEKQNSLKTPQIMAGKGRLPQTNRERGI